MYIYLYTQCFLSKRTRERNMKEKREKNICKMHVCMYACMYVCMYVYMHVCMYEKGKRICAKSICIYIYIYIYIYGSYASTHDRSL